MKRSRLRKALWGLVSAVVSVAVLLALQRLVMPKYASRLIEEVIRKNIMRKKCHMMY